MAKRFPIPEFDHDELKSLDWTPPAMLDAAAAARIAEAAGRGDTTVYGAYPVAASDAFFDALGIRGDHRHAVMCVMPADGVTMTGRSYAWKIQRLVATDGVHEPAPRILVDWKTPRPMNTRLGPAEGIPSPATTLYLLPVHRYSDYWVANRTILDNRWAGTSGNGFRMVSCDSDENDDFHAAVITFEWNDA